MILTVFYCIFITKSYNKLNDIPLSKNGVIDFTNHNTDFEKCILLKGEWEFYYDKWLVDENTLERINKDEKYDIMIDIPSCWATYKDANGQYFPSHGHASYRTILKNYQADPTKRYCIDIERVSAAYRIYISNPDNTTYKLITQNGTITSNTREIASSGEVLYLDLEPFVLDGRDIEIIIECASTQSGGITTFPHLESYIDHSYTKNLITPLNFIIFGILFGSAIFSIFRIIITKSYKLLVFVSLLLTSYAIQIILSPPVFTKLFYFETSINYEVIAIYRMYVTITICFIILYSYFTMIKSALPNFKIPISPIILYAAIMITLIVLHITKFYYVIEPYYSLILVPILAYIIPTTLYSSKYVPPTTGCIVLFFIIFFLGAQTIDILCNAGQIYFDASLISSIFATIGCGTLFIYYIFEINRKEKENKKLTLEISQNNISILLSQIRPHFLYNTLNSINYLIEVDPKRAQQALLQFSTYLRVNMESLTEKELIPFSMELEHIKNYVNIELLRFEGRLKLVYDIQVDDFLIPPLSVQPLVENAIKHGVTKRIEGGTVWISTSEDKNNYYIIIKDNGIGYSNTAPKNEKHKSIGLVNIKEHLRKINNASLQFESVDNVGTTAIITIPKIYQKGGSK